MEIDYFFNVFCRLYPFDRYIFTKPVPFFGRLASAKVTEVFTVPSKNNRPYFVDLYIKVKMMKSVEWVMDTSYLDEEAVGGLFDELRFDAGYIRWDDLITDFFSPGEEDVADPSDVIAMLKKQKRRIIKKYGKCPVKKSYVRNYGKDLIDFI